MQVRECMSEDVHTISPGSPLKSAAETMAKYDLGSLPVALEEKLIGMITDRDIAVRGIGNGWGPDASASEVMTKEVLYCRADDSVRDVLSNMGENQIRRLPVVDDKKRLVGIVSIGDLVKAQPTAGGAGFAQVAEESTLHSQSLN